MTRTIKALFYSHVLASVVMFFGSGCSRFGDPDAREVAVVLEGSAVEAAPSTSVLAQAQVSAAATNYQFMFLQGNDGILYAVSKNAGAVMTNLTSAKLEGSIVYGTNAKYRVTGKRRSIAYVLNTLGSTAPAAVEMFKRITNCYCVAADTIELRSYAAPSWQGILKINMVERGLNENGYWQLDPRIYLQCENNTFELEFHTNTVFTSAYKGAPFTPGNSMLLPVPSGRVKFLIGATYRVEEATHYSKAHPKYSGNGSALRLLLVDKMEFVAPAND